MPKRDSRLGKFVSFVDGSIIFRRNKLIFTFAKMFEHGVNKLSGVSEWPIIIKIKLF